MPTAAKARLRLAALLVCLAGIVIGARWTVLDRYGSDLPSWDQWDAEGLNLLAPWAEHRLTPEMLLAPHNEHRVVLTKLASLALAAADGQWDQRLECAFNALIAAAISAGLFALGLRAWGRRRQGILFVLLASAYALPLAWQNILYGFHSQQLFLVAFSLAAIALLPDARPWGLRWWLGAGAALGAMGSLATGLFAPAVAGGILAARGFRRSRPLRSILPGLCLCAGLVAAGVFTRVSVGYHEALRAHTVSDFLLTSVRSLQWPSGEDRWAWAALVVWAPWAWLSLRLARRGGEGREAGVILAGLGAWVLLQVGATAYARGAGAPWPASRYSDTLVFGALVNALSIGWLSRQAGLARSARLSVLGSLWISVFLLGAWGQTRRIFGSELPAVRTENFYCEENVRHYLASGDTAYLNHIEIPYPDPKVLAERLGTPALRALLPGSVREPLHLSEASCAGFAPGDRGGVSPPTAPLVLRASWGSYGRGAASWESAPLRARLHGWLRFEVAGREAGGLELADPRTGSAIVQVRPSRLPGDTWRSAYVRAPDGEFIVRAAAPDPARWIAFSEPVEMAPLSYGAWRAIRNGPLIAEVSALAAALVLAWGLFTRFCSSSGAGEATPSPSK